MSHNIKRILCYGDSLTSGFCRRGAKHTPYAHPLKEKLQASLENTKIEVDHFGFDGLTTQKLLDNANVDNYRDVNGRPGPGIVKALKTKEYHLIILMAGTNDVLHEIAFEEIISNLNELSKLAKPDDVKSRSILNIGIPDSSIFEDNVSSQTRSQVNKMLANRSTPGMYYMDCPFEYNQYSDNFDPDGLHFSTSGSAEFANGILNRALEILNSL